jgi:hypothetical protein
MDFSPLSASCLSSVQQIRERRAEAEGNLRPVLRFVKKVRGVAVDAEWKKKPGPIYEALEKPKRRKIGANWSC